MRDLNQEELAELDKLSEENTEFKFPVDDTYQRKILCAILKDKSFATEAVQLVKPEYFSNEAHGIIYEFVRSHIRDTGELPEPFLIDNHIREKTSERDIAVTLHFRAELDCTLEYFSPSIFSHKALMRTLRDFAKAQAARGAFHSITETGGNYKLIAGKLPEILSGLQAAECSGGGEFEGWDDVCDKSESEDWLIRNWLEFGSLGMLCGDPFSGKSHIIAEIIASIAKGEGFGPYDVGSCAVVLIDAENKRRILRRRIEKALDGDIAGIRNIFSRLNPSSLTLPMPLKEAPEIVRGLLQRAKRRHKAERVFLVIDTLRSVLGADEMEAGEMKDLLYPLQRVAQEENAAILLLHHRPKSGAKYSGQTSIAGALDYLWLWESDRETGVASLDLIGTRGDAEPKMRFQLRDGRNHWISEPALIGGGSTPQDQLEALLEEILSSGPKPQSALVKEIQNSWKGECPGRDKLKTMISGLVGELICTSEGERNSVLYSLLSD